jgi:hypothetical protein
MQKRVTQLVLIAEVAIIFTLHAVKISQEHKIAPGTSKINSPVLKKVFNTESSHILYIK